MKKRRSWLLHDAYNVGPWPSCTHKGTRICGGGTLTGVLLLRLILTQHCSLQNKTVKHIVKQPDEPCFVAGFRTTLYPLILPLYYQIMDFAFIFKQCCLLLLFCFCGCVLKKEDCSFPSEVLSWSGIISMVFKRDPTFRVLGVAEKKFIQVSSYFGSWIRVGMRGKEKLLLGFC